MVRVRKLPVAVALLLTASLALTACSKGDKVANNLPPSKAAVGGNLTIRLAADPHSLNPLYNADTSGMTVTQQLYASLVELNDKGEPSPYLAESWKSSDDGLSWTIKLRSNVKFHDGNDLTAADVAFTLKSLSDPGYAGPFAAVGQLIKDVTAVDNGTVRVDLKQPYPNLLTAVNVGILEKSQFTGVAVKDFVQAPGTQKPVGAGPYKFVDYKPGRYLVLQRNPIWFMSPNMNGAPFIENVRYKVIQNDQTASAAFANGEIDVLSLAPTAVAHASEQLKEKAKIEEHAASSFTGIVLNTQKFNDKSVRQALTIGLNRQQIIDKSLAGHGTIPAGPISAASPASDGSVKGLAFDAAQAKKLLEQAGYKLNAQTLYEKAGKPLSVTLLAANNNPVSAPVAFVARQNWKAIGVNMELKQVPPADLEQAVKAGNFDMVLTNLNVGNEPDQFPVFHSSQIGNNNVSRFASPAVDGAIEAARKETDPGKRKQLYANYERLVVDEAPVILLAANRDNTAVSNKVLGGVRKVAGVGPTALYGWWMQEKQ